MSWQFNASYPGVSSFYALNYLTQIGITPGTITIRCHPNSTPAARGTVAFNVTNGVTTRSISLPNCLLERPRVNRDESKNEMILRLSDRRWSWKDRYGISGHYNQQDAHRKLIPKWVRSPYQLAVLCLKQMGEPYPAAISCELGGGTVVAVTVHDGGKGYTSPPAVLFVAGAPAAGTTTLVADGVGSVAITNPGSGYTYAPTVVFTGGGGSGAAVTATVAGGKVTGVAITSAGTGYTSAPTVTFTGGFPVSATGTATVSGGQVTGITLTSGGSGYVKPPSVIIDTPAGFFVDLPGGLGVPPSPDSPNAPSLGLNDEAVDPIIGYLQLGANLTPSRTNPLVSWTAIPAAVALSQIGDTYGRCVFLDALTNYAGVQKLGDGTPLPAGKLLFESPEFSPEATPQAVIAMGAPSRYQGQFRFRAVMQDFGDTFVDPSRFSGAPKLPAGRAMVVSMAVADYDTTRDYSAILNGVTFTCLSGSHATAPDVASAIAADISASTDPKVMGKVTATSIGRRVWITAVENGYMFRVRGWRPEWWKVMCPVGPIPDGTEHLNEWDVEYKAPPGLWSTGNQVTLTVGADTYTSPSGLEFEEAVASLVDLVYIAGADYQVGYGGGGILQFSGKTPGVAWTVSGTVVTGSSGASVTPTEIRPPGVAAYGMNTIFPGTGIGSGAMPTPRFAQKEVDQLTASGWCSLYQLVAENPANPDDHSIPMPGGLAAITDRFLLHLQETRAEQVIPRPGDAFIFDTRANRPFAEDTYSGYSRDRQPAVWASVSQTCLAGLNIAVPGGIHNNTGEYARCYIGYQIIDREQGVIRFDKPIFQTLGQGNDAFYYPAEPIIEVSALVDDAATGAPLRFSVTVPVPGGTAPPVTRVYDDVRAEYIGEYDEYHQFTGWRVFDQDAKFRATTYATEIGRMYQNPLSRAVGYTNMELIGLNGLVRQIQWSFSVSGFTTTASENCEFARYQLPYSERRFNENLPPDAQRTLENLATARYGPVIPMNAADAAK